MQNKSVQNEFSDLNWINYIPNHWSLIRLNYILTESKLTSTTGSETLLAVSQYTDVTISERNFAHESYAANEFVGYKLVSQNDLVINIMLAWNGSLGVSMHNGIVSPSYCVYSFDEESHPQYYHYLFRSPMMLSQFMRYSSGIVMSRLRLYPDDLHNILAPKPPFKTQVMIAQYLNDFNSKLSYLIELRKNQIAFLEEYKRAMIQQAVTRGLDPDVPLKPSGVEWLADIPEHWEASQVKRHYSIQLGKMLQNIASEPLDTEVPYLKAQHVQWFAVNTDDPPTMWAGPRDIVQFGICSGDLLVCEGGEGGRAGLVKEIVPGYIIQNALHRVRPLSDSKNEYLQYVMSAIADIGWFEAINNKATIAHFTAEKFGALVIPIPPEVEQTTIVAHLDKLTSDIDEAIAHTRREIELLEEYRTRLIADVVTGKLDVREAAASLPDVNLDDLQPLVEGGEADD